LVERKLPNGMIETYVVEDRGFRKGMHPIPDHYVKPQPYGFRVGRRTSAPWRRALPLLQHAVLFVAAGADAAEPAA